MRGSVERSAGQQGRGFTIIELLVSIGVIAILVGLIVVVGRHAVAVGRESATRQTLRAMKTAVDQFKADHGFLPPLIRDDAAPGLAGPPSYPTYMPAVPLTPTRARFATYRFGYAPDPSDATKVRERDFTQGYQPGGGTPFGGPTVDADDPAGQADRRFSVYSLAVYLGGLGEVTYGNATPAAVVDGVQGPGSYAPADNGTWDVPTRNDRGRTGKTYGARFEDGRGGFKIVDLDLAAGQPSRGRVEIRDSNGVPIRFYRWMQGRPDLNVQNVFDASGRVDSRYFNVPKLLGDPATNPELASAEYGIVAAGPNKYFGDMPIEGSSQADRDAMASDLRTSNAIETLRQRAREDNVVEVGR